MIPTAAIISAKNHPFPDFIRNHKILRTQKSFNKVFKSIGLVNSKSNLNFKHYYDLLIKKNKEKILLHISEISKELSFLFNSNTELKNSYKKKFDKIFDIISSLNEDGFLSMSRLTGAFFVANELMDHRAGDIVGVIYNIANLDNLGKNDSSINISNHIEQIRLLFKKSRILMQQKSYKHSIVFSSTGTRAAWDITTMSMRGIKSCQRWGNDKSRALIGSIVDPNCAIIYITDHTDTEYGERMLKRSVVRLAYNENSEPVILVERVYSAQNLQSLIQKKGNEEVYKEEMFNLFAQFISTKTNNKYPVLFSENIPNISQKYFVPTFPNIEMLNDDEKSYRDSRIAYKEIDKSKKLIVNNKVDLVEEVGFLNDIEDEDDLAWDEDV